MLYNRCNSLSMYGTVRGGQAPFPCNATQWLAPPLATRATATRARDPRPRPPRAIRDRERRQRPPLATRATATRARDQRLAIRARNPLPVGMGRRGWKKGGRQRRGLRRAPAGRQRPQPDPGPTGGTRLRPPTRLGPARCNAPKTRAHVLPLRPASGPRPRLAPAATTRLFRRGLASDLPPIPVPYQ